MSILSIKKEILPMDSCKEDKLTEFQTAVEDNYRMIRAYFRSLGVGADSLLDLTQETFFAAFKSLDRFERGKPYPQWFRGIARIKYYEYCRVVKMMSLQLDELELEAIESEFDSMEKPRGKGRTILSALDQCMKKLDDASLNYLKLFYFDEKPSLEIASLCGVRDATVRKRLQRLREVLHNCVKTATA